MALGWLQQLTGLALAAVSLKGGVLQSLRVHMLGIVLLPVESDLAQGSRRAEPKARAGHADVLFWALIPDNRKGS